MALVAAVVINAGSSTGTLNGLGFTCWMTDVNIQFYCYYDGGLEAGEQFIDGSMSVLRPVHTRQNLNAYLIRYWTMRIKYALVPSTLLKK